MSIATRLAIKAAVGPKTEPNTIDLKLRKLLLSASYLLISSSGSSRSGIRRPGPDLSPRPLPATGSFRQTPCPPRTEIPKNSGTCHLPASPKAVRFTSHDIPRTEITKNRQTCHQVDVPSSQRCQHSCSFVAGSIYSHLVTPNHTPCTIAHNPAPAASPTIRLDKPIPNHRPVTSPPIRRDSPRFFYSCSSVFIRGRFFTPSQLQVRYPNQMSANLTIHSDPSSPEEAASPVIIDTVRVKRRCPHRAITAKGNSN
jgi:hypothetical protein